MASIAAYVVVGSGEGTIASAIDVVAPSGAGIATIDLPLMRRLPQAREPDGNNPRHNP
jgi:hypothetical protein